MKQFPQPGEHEIMLRHLQTEAGLKMTTQAPEEDPEKAARHQERFRKEHPDLYEEETGSVGEAISVNGELLDTKGSRRKKRVARWYSFLSWLKVWGWVIVAVIAVYLALFPVPIPIDRTMPYAECEYHVTRTGTMRIKGTYYWYMIKPNRFKGKIQTENADIKVESKTPDNLYYSTTWTTMILYKIDGDCPLGFLGYFGNEYDPCYIKGLFGKLLLYSNSSHYLAAPAENMEEAGKLIRKANADLYY